MNLDHGLSIYSAICLFIGSMLILRSCLNLLTTCFPGAAQTQNRSSAVSRVTEYVPDEPPPYHIVVISDHKVGYNKNSFLPSYSESKYFRETPFFKRSFSARL